MLGEYGGVGEGWGEGGERGGEGDVECQALWGDCGHVFVNATYYISSSPFINLSPSRHLSHPAHPSAPVPFALRIPESE